jgi:hypothetical protein
MRKITITLLVIGGCFVVPQRPAAQTRDVDVERSVVTVHVFKSGLFSAFADNHEIRAPITRGSVNESEPSAEIAIDARNLRVIDADLPADKRAEVQQRMLGPDVLDSAQFPEIRFRSTTVRPVGSGRWRVEGTLTLHGESHPAAVDVTGGNGRYHGSATIRQRDFGITPISIVGGTVKVKNEVRLEFDVLLSRD